MESFRKWFEYNSPVRKIAHVGWVGSSYDHEMNREATAWLKANWASTESDMTNVQNDYIDLSAGRDFLTEGEQYSVVILYHVYAGGGNDPAAFFATSPQHSPQEWRRRLESTEAEVILAFGNNEFKNKPSEVSGTYLGNLRGYSKRDYPRLTIYEYSGSNH